MLPLDLDCSRVMLDIHCVSKRGTSYSVCVCSPYRTTESEMNFRIFCIVTTHSLKLYVKRAPHVVLS